MSLRYLAIDIGEAIGRHILGYLENGKLRMEEIHRFENGTIDDNGVQCWDLNYLFNEIKLGLKKSRENRTLPIFIGITTWGDDFVLLDHEDKVIGDTQAYCFNSAKRMEEKVNSSSLEERLKARTGNQKQISNTIHQLMMIREKHPDYLNRAESILMIPDYFNFLLSGVKQCEYTNTLMTQLVDPATMVWDEELIQMLGYPLSIFQKISQPGSILGNLNREVNEEIGYDCIVLQSADILKRLTSEYTPKMVYTGPIEDAAIGNLLVLMISSFELKDLQAAQECVRNTFEIKE